MLFSKLTLVATLGVAAVSAQLYARDAEELGALDLHELVARDAYDEFVGKQLQARDAYAEYLDAHELWARAAAAEPARRPNAPSFPPGTINKVNSDYNDKKKADLQAMLNKGPQKKDPSEYKPNRPNEHSSKEYFSSKDADHYGRHRKRSAAPVRRPNAPSFPPGTISQVNKDYDTKKKADLQAILDKGPQKKDPSEYKPNRPNEHSSKEYFSGKDADHYGRHRRSVDGSDFEDLVF